MISVPTDQLERKRVLTLGSLGLLHLWDAGVTLYFLRRGLATELNPLMALMYSIDPTYFLFSKAFLVIWGSVILGFAWEHPSARRGAYTLTWAYGALALYELLMLILHTVFP